MRNGNRESFGYSIEELAGSYRTYEEWKQSFTRFKTSEIGKVLTVPMRNGNFDIVCDCDNRFFWFLPYLWGMETSILNTILWLQISSSYRTYEEWKPQSPWGLINGVRVSSYRTYEEWKLFQSPTSLSSPLRFLPYLWGMETVHSEFDSFDRVGSYRTYEEWKRFSMLIPAISNISSYRTYEEWKHCLRLCLCRGLSRSYRTYEEWKQQVLQACYPMQIVLTVPMRNGNWSRHNSDSNPGLCSYRTYEEWKRKLKELEGLC